MFDVCIYDLLGVKLKISLSTPWKGITRIAPLILNLGIRWNAWLTPRPSALLSANNPGTRWTEVWLDPAPVWRFWWRERSLIFNGIRTPDRPASILVAIPTTIFSTWLHIWIVQWSLFVIMGINPLNPELNPICCLLALLELTIFSTLAG